MPATQARFHVNRKRSCPVRFETVLANTRVLVLNTRTVKNVVGTILLGRLQVKKQEEAYKRLQARNGLKRTLNTMFSHALANRAATQRLARLIQYFKFVGVGAERV